MAHFAKIGDDNIVEQVIVIGNEITDPENTGTDTEQLGLDFIADVLKLEGTWVQTSYNDNIRGSFAHIGGTYDSSLDKFQEPKPFDSWIWDDTKNEYVAPLPHPLADIDPNDESAQPDYITSKPDDEIWLHRWNEAAYQADNTTGWEFVQWTQADEDALQGQNLGE